MPKIKWSAFPNAGDLQSGDIIVGLRAGNNVQLNPVTPNDVQVSLFNYSLATGVNDAFVATLVPPVTSLTDGLLVTLNTGSLTNNTGTPTLQVDAMPAKTIVYNNLQLLPGDLEVNNTYVLVYNSTTQTFNLINPSISAANTDLVQYNEYNAAIDSGIADAYIANLTPPASSLTGFLSILCKITNANTGASTLTVNGNTAPIVTANNQPLVGGELIANQVALFLYDSTWASFILVNPSNNVTTLLPVINHRLARFDGTSGRIQNSSATLADSGVLTLTADAVINTVNVGLGGGSIATNTRVGVSALASNTTGARNVAEGYQALTTSTTANDITAVGYRALTLNTVANNTAVGSGAMDAVTTGTGVAVGKDALGALTTGTGNCAVGQSALLLMTTATNNTAVGETAGLNNSANGGTFIGWQAGYNNTSGIQNVAVGAAAGGQFRTGSSNTAIGTQAMGTLGTSAVANCVYVGQSAGISCTGDNNTGLGYFAGNSGATGAVAVTTGTANTMVGYRACPNAADATGTISIGADAVAEKATGATSGDNGPGIAIGSASTPVGFRGDGTIYAAAGASAGYWRVKINGTFYKILLCADA